MKIAVVKNDNQQTSSIFEPGLIAIYEEDGGEWKVLNRFENKVCNAKSMAAVRMAVVDTIKQLDDVKVVVASEIPGIASGTFQAAGFDIILVENSVLGILQSKKKLLRQLRSGRKGPASLTSWNFWNLVQKKVIFRLI
ncbi:AnfO protein, required for Mo- and V-independent nitrogenase [Methanosarcina lacustris Z-7289]|uniref:AnfO protein, required for Mo-and V-independent nitrogenase n=1 Tax=Methanosarcina lacustris Z-7289 TaxID=1434111 RepID=A0A0E3S333_9EURY|nr:Fe-only nitrogenase accessory protein AnfO [Methanosarcina lacustris]AKB75279.1 AnfO protein, required for Mo- and V-independent nitrogenase [Methanosarcina lacustris Z-7289]